MPVSLHIEKPENENSIDATVSPTLNLSSTFSLGHHITNTKKERLVWLYLSKYGI